MGFKLDLDDLREGLRKYAEAAETTITQLTDAWALNLESYAKRNKPWTNRTGEAQRRLKGTSKKTDDYVWTITLSHGVDYGIWLELAHEQRYAIIEPTIRVNSSKLIKDFNKALEAFGSRL